ncbi:SET domain-containing protein [Anaeromyces robustus]|uniref:SET domain-containing protein n=1 Tax=Anaeromyces robustus TaxID=1754192 RepID=A0A1Y1WSF0_9FUNG|nr:SET domain-containing protein [Anaeromyces robustus]|eukprot:ORX76064.1 SET domain-containing protein [Anaeromyces robustus]
MVTTKQIFIGITVTSITIFICSQFLKLVEANDDKEENETDNSNNQKNNNNERKGIRLRLRGNGDKKNENSSPKTFSKDKKKLKQNEEQRLLDKNEILNKLEKLFSKRNYKIVEKIITQMIEDSDHEKYLEWLSNQEKNIYIKTLNKGKKSQKLNKGVNICVISKKDILPGEIIYSEKPVVSILNPYLDQEEYCQSCFKKIIFQDNVEEKKENFCSKECEIKSKESKRLFNNIFSSDEISEKSYFSTMSSCYGISSYDIESEIIYYDNPEVETINLVSKPNRNGILTPPHQSSLPNNVKIINEIFEDGGSQNLESNIKKLNFDQNYNDNDVEIIKINDHINQNNNDNDDDNISDNNSHYQDDFEIDKESLFQFFDTKTKSTTTSGVNEKILSYYDQLCWEKEYFYPLLILKVLILIIQDELCFKKKIKLLEKPSTTPPQKHINQKNNCPNHNKNNVNINNNNNNNNNNNDNDNITNYNNNNNNNNKNKFNYHHFQHQQQQHQQKINYPKPSNEKITIYTLWDHIETFPYIEEYPKYTDLNNETNNAFSKYDLKFFNLIHTLFYDVFYEFEDFFTDDMYQVLKQKVMYNTIGITSNENFSTEKTLKDIYRIDSNKSVIGLGIYFISSYIRHCCHPNAKVCYLNNNNTLSLISTQYIKKGEEITISYIDTHNKSSKKCHEELYNKFKIKCFCNK